MNFYFEFIPLGENDSTQKVSAGISFERIVVVVGSSGTSHTLCRMFVLCVGSSKIDPLKTNSDEGLSSFLGSVSFAGRIVDDFLSKKDLEIGK